MCSIDHYRPHPPSPLNTENHHGYKVGSTRRNARPGALPLRYGVVGLGVLYLVRRIAKLRRLRRSTGKWGKRWDFFKSSGGYEFY